MKSVLRAFVENKAPVQFVRKGTFTQGMPAGGSIVQLLQSYQGVGTLFAIIDRLATGTASVNWHLYRGDPSTKFPDPSTEVLKHPAKDLWDHPNPHFSQSDFVETFQQHLDLVGEGWWIVGRSKLGFGPPLELWPVRPDKMSPVPDADQFISGYLYKNGSEAVPLSAEPGKADVIFLRRPNPLDLYRGAGPVQSILMDLDAERFSAMWNRNFFLNSAEPGGIIEVDRNLSDDEFNEMALRWQEQHQGVANAHRVAILEKGKWVERKYTQRDMQFALLRQSNREVIMLAYGFPKSLLGVTETVNRSTAEAEEMVFARWLLRPRLERIKQALNEKLLPLFGASGQGVYFSYENPEPPDHAQETLDLTAKTNAAKVLIDSGFDPIEVCEYLDLPLTTFSKPAPAPNPFAAPTPGADLAAAMLNKVDPVTAARIILESNWTKRLETERKDLEKHLD